MKKFIAPLIVSAIFILFALQVSADTPVVHSFNVPASLESGQAASFDWTITGGGHSLIVFCSQGIKLRYASTNLVFPCDTKVSVSNAASDGVALIVANVSGNPRIITARIIPKNANGAIDYDAGAMDASIYVKPSLQPISGFYTNATTTLSGSETKFYWSSTYLDGVNFKISCNSSITATSSIVVGKIVPCGEIISQTDLPSTGSVSFLFNNQSESSFPVDVMVIPAMSPGVYDGTHALVLTITVASDAQKPISVTSFTASRNKIFSGDSVLLSWSIVNATAANLRISCAHLMQYQQYQFLGGVSSTTVSLPCNDFASTTLLKATATTSISFFNLGEYPQTVTVSLFAQLKNSTYDGSKTASINITVEPTTKFSASFPINVAQPVSTAPITTIVANSLPTPLPVGTSALLGCAGSYGFSIMNGLPCSDGAFTSKIYEITGAAELPDKPALIPGCAGSYGFSIYTGQLCASKPTTPSRFSPGAGVYLGGWSGWNGSKKAVTSVKVYFARPLDIGSRGDDVRLLQSFLAKDKELYPEGYINGYFGLLTARAVGRLQLRHGLVKSVDEPTYGFVGPSTRILLNSLQ